MDNSQLFEVEYRHGPVDNTIASPREKPKPCTVAVVASPTLHGIVARLRAAGGRLTEPRRAVIEALLSGADHPTADDLAARIAEHHPTVHKSTVYRTLDALTELGVVDHVHLGHGRAVYHLSADSDLHLLCERCGAVAHIEATVLDSSRASILDDTGFVLEAGHFALPGLCRACVTPELTQ